MGGKTLVKNTLVLVIIALFIVSAVSPMVIGFKSDAVDDVERDEFLDKLAYSSYSIYDNSAKSEYYKEKLLNDNFNDDIDVVEEDIVQPVEPSPITSSGGPMDSPWPMFCHDVRHTGRSPYGINGKYLMEKWRFKLADYAAFSSPVIDENGTIYICVAGPGLDGTLHAINPNGTEKWRFTAEATGWHEGWIRHISPAISADGTIYFGDYQGYLYAVYQNGTLKWKTMLKSGIISSPTIADDGTIYIGAADKMCAVYPNGTIKWQYKTGNAIRASPVIGQDGTIYVSSHDGYLYAFHPNNGTVKWKLKVAGGLSCYSSPAIDDNGIIYVGTRYDFYAINPNGTVRWMHDGGGCYYGGPTIDYDGTIYAAGGERLWAFTPDGKEKWNIEIGDYHSSPAITNNSMILIGGGDIGKIYLISPVGEKFSYWIFEGDREYSFCHIESSPAIWEDGTIYIGSWFGDEESFDGYLHAIEVKEHAPDLRIEMKGKFARLKVDFKNVGDVDASNIEWDIYIEYWGIWCLQVRNLHSEGTFPILKAGEKKTQFAWPIFLLGYGFAEIDIWVNAPDANPDKKEELWLVFGPFIFPQ